MINTAIWKDWATDLEIYNVHVQDNWMVSVANNAILRDI